MDATDLLHGVFRMQVLHELVAVCDIDASFRHGNAHSVREADANVVREPQSPDDLGRDVDGVDGRGQLGDRGGHGAIAASDLEKRHRLPQKATDELDLRLDVRSRTVRVGLPCQLRMKRNAPEELVVHLGIQPPPAIPVGRTEPIGKLLLDQIVLSQLLGRTCLRHLGAPTAHF